MPAIDLVVANEFAFTPSAFIAAYIEQSETETIAETTSNGGSLQTVPLQESNIEGRTIADGYAFNKEGILTAGMSFYNQTSQPPTTPIALTGSLLELVGQGVTDTRTTTKTTTNTKGVANTVVLVLSYGTLKAKCTDAQATISLIYSQVANYLNSL